MAQDAMYRESIAIAGISDCMIGFPPIMVIPDIVYWISPLSGVMPDIFYRASIFEFLRMDPR